MTRETIEQQRREACENEFVDSFFSKSKFHLGKLEDIKLAGNTCMAKLKGESIDFGKSDKTIGFTINKDAVEIHRLPKKVFFDEPAINKLIIQLKEEKCEICGKFLVCPSHGTLGRGEGD